MERSRLKLVNFSSADKVAGQGVGSAFQEQVELVKETSANLFDVEVNQWFSKPDIQHFHTIDPAFFVRMKDKGPVNIAYCHFLPDTLEGSLKIPKPFMKVAAWYITNFYKSADRLVVVNPSFIEELVRYGIPREMIYYIPNYVSKEQFHPFPAEDRAAWRRKYGIPEDAFVVLGAGQVQTRKGVRDFVDVAKALPELTFVWAGGFSFGKMTDGYEDLEKLMKEPPANVVFTDIVPRDDMPHVYNMADVLFVPSYNELFPMTILESANFGLPIVVRDLDLYKDILFGHVQKGDDNAAFTTQLKKLAEDPQERKHWQEESAKIADYYSKENVGRLWRDFYLDAWHDRQKASSHKKK